MILDSGPYEFLKKNFQNLEKIFINSQTEGLILLENNQIDYLFLYEYSGKFLAKKNNLYFLETKSGNQENNGHAFLLNKKDKILQKQINKILKIIEQNGELDALKKKYNFL